MNFQFNTKLTGGIPKLHKPLGKMKQVVNDRAFQLLSNKDSIRTLKIRKSLGETSMIGISSKLKNDNVLMNQISKLILRDF